MSTVEDQFAIFLDHQKKYGRLVTSMSGVATGSMWLGLNTIGGPFSSTRRAAEIIRAVLYVTSVSQSDFLSHRRQRHVAEARQLAYWFMRHYTSLSSPQIGRFVGNRDHATVLHGIKVVSRRPRAFGPRLRAISEILMVEPPKEVQFQ